MIYRAMDLPVFMNEVSRLSLISFNQSLPKRERHDEVHLFFPLQAISIYSDKQESGCGYPNAIFPL
jgi:hypothetical protein